MNTPKLGTQVQQNPQRIVRKSLENCSNEELMTEFQRGTVIAFDLLVERLNLSLKRYAHRFVHCPIKSEDVVQGTWLRAYRFRHSYRDRNKVSTWLYTIARNLAISEYRQYFSKPTSSLHYQDAPGNEYYLLTLSDTNLPSPDYQVSESTTNQTIIRALEYLTDSQRELVIMRDFQGLSYEEMVTITGDTMGTVKSRLHRGRKKLQKILADRY